MSYFTATLILAVCTLLAVVLCVPFIYLARGMRRRRAGHDQAPTGTKLSVRQAVPALVLVVALFFAFAHQYTAPQSWLGARVTSTEGRIWLSVLALLLACVTSYCWGRLKTRATKEERNCLLARSRE